MLKILKNLIFPLKINHIKNNTSLQNLCQDIEKYKICAIDTEFMRNRTYYPILCLVQINVNDKLYIIDPIANKLNLSPLYKIFSNKKITKIIHSARHDLEVLFFNKASRNYHNIVDTQIMANFCHFNHNIGYKLLVKKLCSKKLCDESQRSNWKKRPLTDKQTKYAALDVKYLIKIYQKLDQKLQKLDRKSWFDWEMKDFIKKCKDHDPSDPENLIKRFSLNKRNQNYIENIKIISVIRDNICKRVNLPKNFIIHDEVIEKIMQDRPQEISDLNKYKSINKKISQEEKQQIIDIFNSQIEEDNKEDIEQNNSKPLRLNKKQLATYNKVKQSVSKVSENYKIDKSFIINDKNIKLLIAKEAKLSHILQDWRLKILGEKIKNII